MLHTSYSRTLLLSLISMVAGVSASGCGGDERTHVSGEVVFDGRPVPAGKVYLTPDSAKGNSGPSGFANITDGFYDTAAEGGRGTVLGPLIVAVEGIDPSAPAEGGQESEDVTAKLLFARWELAADLTEPLTTLDIDVPAEAADGPKQPAGTRAGVIP